MEFFINSPVFNPTNVMFFETEFLCVKALAILDSSLDQASKDPPTSAS